MLGQRRRRWPNIRSALGECIVLAWIVCLIVRFKVLVGSATFIGLGQIAQLPVPLVNFAAIPRERVCFSNVRPMSIVMFYDSIVY